MGVMALFMVRAVEAVALASTATTPVREATGAPGIVVVISV
jgi:hypothetical protein